MSEKRKFGSSVGGKSGKRRRVLTWKGWQDVFFAGTEWDAYGGIFSSYDWDFSHLLEFLDQHEEKNDGRCVYLFGQTEPQLISENVVMVPAIISVVSSVDPPSLFAVKSVQMAGENLIPFSQLKASWVKVFPHTSILSCRQRRAAVPALAGTKVREFTYAVPCLLRRCDVEETDDEEDVDVLLSLDEKESPLVFDFSPEMDTVKERAESALSEAGFDVEKYRSVVEKAIRQAVKEQRVANASEREERRKVYEKSGTEEVRSAWEKIELHKFYPMSNGDTSPDVSSHVTPFINRYYGKAKEVHSSL